ncbi:MAG: hypothetical protein M1823_002023 [Watsoniomyces obsoletus]|nr:MAG: hypothetical protein M1823_002023 [Watsoniomyces obsoletus]
MSFSSLPVELAQEILSHLPVRSLNNFSLTSQTGYILARSSLRRLDLGIFHTRINNLIALMHQTSSRASTNNNVHSVSIHLPTKDIKTRQQIVRNQNSKAASVLHQHGSTLRDLELVLWELEKPVADALSSMPNLRRLSLRFDHPFVRHPTLQKNYWNSASTGSVWDLLSRTDDDLDGDGGSTPVLGRLEALNLERAGITDWQLMQIIERNPGMTELKLQKCTSLTGEFFAYLAKSPIAKTLKTLHFTRNDKEDIDDRVLDHIGELKNLKSLSLYGCKHVDPELCKALNERCWHVEDLTLPYTTESPLQEDAPIEVDPAYK